METLAGFNADMDPRNRRTAMDVMAERGLADQPKREGSVHSTLMDCGSRIERLEKSLSLLHDRLNPVLRSIPPANAEKEAAEPCAPCTLATGIDVQARRVMNLMRLVESMLDRLEL